MLYSRCWIARPLYRVWRDIRRFYCWGYGLSKVHHGSPIAQTCVRVILKKCISFPSAHPDVDAEFKQGGFSVQCGSNNPFGRIPVDQTIEETTNRGAQTPGGTKGFSLKPGAVTAKYRMVYLRTLRDMIGQYSSKPSHPDTQGPRIRTTEADIKSLVDLVEYNWLNPLPPDEPDLVDLSTGTVTPMGVVNDLLTYQETFSQVGQSWDVQPQLFEKAQQFTCHTCVAARSTAEVNGMRYQLFCARRDDIEASLLPQCRYRLSIHLIWANYRQHSGSAVYLLVPQCPTLPTVHG